MLLTGQIAEITALLENLPLLEAKTVQVSFRESEPLSLAALSLSRGAALKLTSRSIHRRHALNIQLAGK